MISVSDLVKKLSGKTFEDLSKYEKMEGEGYEINKDASD